MTTHPSQETETLPSTTDSVRLTRGTLHVVEGPGAGQWVTVEHGSVTLGSSEGVDLKIPDRAVSRRHAQLAVVEGQFLLRDLESRNGTFVNSTRIREAFLQPGDTIAIGKSVLRFEPRTQEIRVPPSTQDHFGRLHGQSRNMRQIFGILERVSPGEATVLISGESGTGKDLVAQAIHAASSRFQGPFVVFDCSALSAELIASELFGHVEGAFTGAQRRRQGAFETASKGTIFLDEIGELPLDLQANFLRALENRTVRPVGSNVSVPVDVRVVAATHRNLEELVRLGKFREDLYYRLAVITVQLPPLRQRLEDLPVITAALLDGMKTSKNNPSITPAALANLAAHTWPGNVRELRNVLERSLALAGSSTIDAHDLVIERPLHSIPPAPPPAPSGTLDDAERVLIENALAKTGYNQLEAAELLGIHRNTLRRKLEKYRGRGQGGQ